jgi:hypothetical protein
MSRACMIFEPKKKKKTKKKLFLHYQLESEKKRLFSLKIAPPMAASMKLL